MDLNRVEEACKHLADIFGVSISTKVWAMEDFRTESEMARMLDNINKLRVAYYTKYQHHKLRRESPMIVSIKLTI